MFVAREFWPEDEEQIIGMKKEIEEYDGNFEGLSDIQRIQNFNDFLTDLERKKHEETVNANFSPQTMFGFFVDGKLVGGFVLRHDISKGALINHGGNIGYFIRPSERKKGYGTEMLKSALEKAKDIGLDKIMVSCRKENIASAKVIESNGGIFENERYDDVKGETYRRYWIRL